MLGNSGKKRNKEGRLFSASPDDSEAKIPIEGEACAAEGGEIVAAEGGMKAQPPAFEPPRRAPSLIDNIRGDISDTIIYTGGAAF